MTFDMRARLETEKPCGICRAPIDRENQTVAVFPIKFSSFSHQQCFEQVKPAMDSLISEIEQVEKWDPRQKIAARERAINAVDEWSLKESHQSLSDCLKQRDIEQLTELFNTIGHQAAFARLQTLEPLLDKPPENRSLKDKILSCFLCCRN